METTLLKRRLIDVSDRLRRLQDDLAVVTEQVEFYEDAVDEARLQALAAETPLSDARARDIRQQADALLVRQKFLTTSIEGLRVEQDALLDRMSQEMTPQ